MITRIRVAARSSVRDAGSERARPAEAFAEPQGLEPQILRALWDEPGAALGIAAAIEAKRGVRLRIDGVIDELRALERGRFVVSAPADGARVYALTTAGSERLADLYEPAPPNSR